MNATGEARLQQLPLLAHGPRELCRRRGRARSLRRIVVSLRIRIVLHPELRVRSVSRLCFVVTLRTAHRLGQRPGERGRGR